MEDRVGELCSLPEGCIAHVISLTSPRDACRLSAVSAVFRSAAASDAVWNRFLPSDYPSIISRAAVDPHPAMPGAVKDLFFRLCHHPLLLDTATVSFWLDKSSGAKCYMLSARALSITLGDNPEYWAWNRIPDSRFEEVAELRKVSWLEIVGRIENSKLSPKTAYVAYLVFKIADNWRGLHYPKQETCITLGRIESKHTVCLQPDAGGRIESKRTVCLQPDAGTQQIMRLQPGAGTQQIMCSSLRPFRFRGRQMPQETMDAGVISPRARSDSWMEVEMGMFYNETEEDDEVEMSFREITGGNWKKGLIVQGIEIRPKM